MLVLGVGAILIGGFLTFHGFNSNPYGVQSVYIYVFLNKYHDDLAHQLRCGTAHPYQRQHVLYQD